MGFVNHIESTFDFLALSNGIFSISRKSKMQKSSVLLHFLKIICINIKNICVLQIRSGYLFTVEQIPRFCSQCTNSRRSDRASDGQLLTDRSRSAAARSMCGAIPSRSVRCAGVGVGLDPVGVCRRSATPVTMKAARVRISACIVKPPFRSVLSEVHHTFCRSRANTQGRLQGHSTLKTPKS